MLGPRVDDDLGIDVGLGLQDGLGFSDLLDSHDAVVIANCHRQVVFHGTNVFRNVDVAGMRGEEGIRQRPAALRLCVCRVMAELDGVQTAPAEARDADRDGGALVFAELSQEFCDSGPGDAQPIAEEERKEVDHRGDDVVSSSKDQLAAADC